MFNVRGLDGRHAVRTWRVAIAAWLLLAFVATAEDDVRAYDIPAQPLEQAVERFSVSSGWSVMYAGELAAGRRSYPLHASLPPLQALQTLLQETGVEAEVIGAQRVVLRLGAQPERAAGTVGLLPESERSRRFGGLQQRLRDAFCDDPLLAPGRYAATLRFRITAEGHVDEAELLVGSGDARRDRRLLLAIGRLAPSIDAAALPQPVTLQIQPSRADHDCGRRQPLP